MSTVISRTVTEEAESYSSSVAGVYIEAVQAGPSDGATEVLATVGDRFAFTAGKIGFPMLTSATIPDDKIVVAYARFAPPGSRWSGVDLQSGSVVGFGPAAEHTTSPNLGLHYAFAVTDSDQLEQHADLLGVMPGPPRRGEVRGLDPSALTKLAGEAFGAFADIAASGRHPPQNVGDDVLRAIVHLITDHDGLQRVGRRKQIDPRRIVHACIDYAESVGRIPSINELCAAACVSERCLRAAFVKEFDRPPTQYFRAWALERAHRRLLHADHHDLTVTDVATGLGWNHLGRFAVRYKEIYGETPLRTLHAASC